MNDTVNDTVETSSISPEFKEIIEKVNLLFQENAEFFEKDEVFKTLIKRKGDLSAAAACLSIHSALELKTGLGISGTPAWWPIDPKLWSTGSPRENILMAIIYLLIEFSNIPLI